MNFPKKPTERRAWIIYQLRLRGISFRKLALQEGVSPQAISAATTSANSHLQPVIAKAIGLTAQQLFPEFYTSTGELLTWAREQHRNTASARRNVEEERAA